MKFWKLKQNYMWNFNSGFGGEGGFGGFGPGGPTGPPGEEFKCFLKWKI